MFDKAGLKYLLNIYSIEKLIPLGYFYSKYFKQSSKSSILVGENGSEYGKLLVFDYPDSQF